MATNINRTNGTTIGTIVDGTLDTSTTSLGLVGRNYSNYGQVITDDLVKLLENFSHNISPSNPLSGQLWWDTAADVLKVYTGTSFKVVGNATAQVDAPTAPVTGDIWWKTSTKQLFIYDGTAPYAEEGWILVGPTWPSTANKSGALWEQILDNASTLHDVVVLYLAGIKAGIISGSTFVPNVAISGFTTIYPGINLAGATEFAGTASNATNLGGVAASNYLRKDIDNVAAGNLHITTDEGITLGVGLDATLNVNSTTVQLTNNTTDANIALRVSPSGVVTDALVIDGATGLITVAANPTDALGITTKQYVDAKFTDGEFFGNTVAPTAVFGTSTTQIATTAFVQAAFDQTKIIQGDSQFAITDTGTGSAQLIIDGTSVMSATVSGVSLGAGTVAVTQSQLKSDTGDARVATTSYAKTAAQWWGGSAKFVSTSAPVPGVNDIGSQDGDFFFQTQA